MMRYRLNGKGNAMKRLFKKIELCYADDDSIILEIYPVEDAEKMEMMCCREEVKATAKDINEAIDKIKGIVGLSPKKNEKSTNVIKEFLKG